MPNRTKHSLIHIHRNTSAFSAIVPLKNLYRLLTLNWLFEPEKTGIPAELVEKVYDDYSGLTVLPGKPVQVCCVSPVASDQLAYMLQAIAVFNSTDVFSLSVFSPHSFPHSLQEYANDRISFLSADTSSLQAGIVITYGPGALHFIKNKIPVIILGPLGFGGLVTASNFNWFLENGFMGRPGGTPGEEIPASLVLDELMECHEKQSLLFAADALNELSRAAEALPFRPLSYATGYMQEARLLYDQLHHKHQRWLLKPILASNISLLAKENNLYLRRAHINTTLAVLQKKDQSFFKLLNGQNTCRQLITNTPLGEDDFWNYLYTLWEKKIILFHAV